MRPVLSLRRFAVDDLDRLKIGALQAEYLARLPRGESARVLIDGGEAWTLVQGEEGTMDAEPVACGGLLYFTPARARAWALIGDGMTRRCWALAALKMRARLDEVQGWRGVIRVEAETPMAFPPGHRFLRHLGFRFEGRMEGCGINGEAFALYGRVDGNKRTAATNRYYALLRKALVVVWEDEVAPLPANSLNLRRVA